MSDYRLREFLPEDRAELAALWHKVFGDPEELILAFLQRLPSFGVGAVAELEGRAVGAAYALEGLCSGLAGGDVPCDYIYAVAVAPEHRHHGLGAALSQKAAELSKSRGSRLICTLPAEESLYPWYEKILGVSCALRRRSFMAKAAPLLPCREAGAEEYLSRREALLEGRILGAGLDTLAPEPTPADHPLVDLPEGVRDRVVLAPHLGGITTGSFRRAHRSMASSSTSMCRSSTNSVSFSFSFR